MIRDKYDYVIKNNLVKVRKNGIIYKKNKNGKFKEVPQYKTEKGYMSIVVYDEGKNYNLLVHRLVAKVFIANEHKKPIVNHIDRNRSNNNSDNLEWCTAAENSQHARRTNPVYKEAKCIYCNANTKIYSKVCAKCRYEIFKSKRNST